MIYWEGSEYDLRGALEVVVAIRRQGRREVARSGTLLGEMHRAPPSLRPQYRLYTHLGGRTILVRDPFMHLKWKKLSPVADLREGRRETSLSQATQAEEGMRRRKRLPSSEEERRANVSHKRRQANPSSTSNPKKAKVCGLACACVLSLSLFIECRPCKQA